MRACPGCGAQNRLTAKRCQACGGMLAASQDSGCPQCSAPVRRGARFCSHCGAAVARQCPRCGHNNRPTARFCSLCQTTLGVSRPPQVSVPPQRPGRRPGGRGTGDLTDTLLHNRYQLDRLIAQGGMGAVYHAIDTRPPGGVWAVKVMSHAQLKLAERAEAVALFRREAEMLMQLRHPHLPLVEEVFEEEGRQYMVMEYIEGETLQAMLDRSAGPLAEGQVRAWVEQICSALGYLHQQTPPIIYRDLKPSNIIAVQATNTIKLIDFGIARFHRKGQKKDTASLGTPGYAAPEQYGAAQTDVRSDIYALGVTIHQLLTKHDPTRGKPLEMLPSVTSLNSLVSPAWDKVIAKATHLRPRDRYASMAALLKAIPAL